MNRPPRWNQQLRCCHILPSGWIHSIRLAARNGRQQFFEALPIYLSGLSVPLEIYRSFDDKCADLLYEVMNRSYESKAVILATKKPFKEWNDVFPNAACVGILLDRLLHYADVTVIEGDSYIRESEQEAAARRREQSTMLSVRRPSLPLSSRCTPNSPTSPPLSRRWSISHCCSCELGCSPSSSRSTMSAFGPQRGSSVTLWWSRSLHLAPSWPLRSHTSGRKVAYALFLAAALNVTSSAQTQTAPVLLVGIKPGPMDEKVGRGYVDISIAVPAPAVAAGEPLLSMDIVSGNTESVPRKLQNVAASDDEGRLTLLFRDDPEGLSFSRHWTAPRRIMGDLKVSYRAPIDNSPPGRCTGSPTMLRIDGDGMSGVGNMFLILPETPQPYRIAIDWDLSAMASSATATSSFGDGDVEIPAGSARRLEQTVFMAGTMKREPSQPARGFSSAWLGEPPFDPRSLMDWTEKLHTWMASFFHDDVNRPYRVFLRFNPINAGGGSAFINSFFTTYNDKTQPDSINPVIAHEMVHTWTAAGPGRWYSEGNAVHYQALLPWRAGLISTDDFLADLNSTTGRYYSDSLNRTPDDQIMPRFWEDTRIRTLPYDRGAMYFAVLDGKIRKASGGRRSIDDLILAMVMRSRSSQSVNEAAWLDLVSKDLGEEGIAITHSMLAGGLMLPESGDFGPCFRRTTKTIRRFDLGFDPKSLVGDVKTIKGLVPGSEAEKAGLKNGDIVTYSQALDFVQGNVTQMLTLNVVRGGKTFQVSYLPRGEHVKIYQWVRVEGVPDTSCKYQRGLRP